MGVQDVFSDNIQTVHFQPPVSIKLNVCGFIPITKFKAFVVVINLVVSAKMRFISPISKRNCRQRIVCVQE